MLLKKINLPERTGRDSFALVATLALVAVATLLLVLFVTVSSLDRAASYSYSQSVKADQIGLGGLHLVVGQLQAEMSKDALPDTNYSGALLYYAPIYTNVTSVNIQPQATVTNSAIPILVKMSTNNWPFYTTGTLTTGGLQATSISTTTPSLNGRSVSTNVWNQSYFGQYPNSAAAPYWILMTRSGATNGANITLGITGTTLNNPSPGNTNYVLGRVAYAIYDEGRLLDVTAAGYASDATGTGSLTPVQLSQIKGTLAGADLTQVGISSPKAFVQWRNAASAASANAYVSYVTNFASTNGFLQVAQGDSTFLGRQDLIRAAQNNIAGLSTSALTNLTTFTRELNAPSWAPSVNGVATIKKVAPAQSVVGGYSYAINSLNLTGSPFSTAAGKQNPNPFIPLVRHTGITGPATITGYNSNGTTYFYAVNPGDSVVQHRFPLDRLNWITPEGPSASLATTDPFYNPGGTAAAIQACFGLYYGTVENIIGDANWTGIKVWKYVGSVGTATSTTKEKIASSATTCVIETLSDVGAETTAREPNFFELLQAGILSGSLALTTGSSQTMTSTGENYSSLQLLRIGASMIAQVQPQAYPINVEYNQNDGGNISVVASGVANLPYLNTLKFVTGVSPTDTNPGAGKHQMGIYGLIGLWNPHQQPAAAVTRPPLRLYLQGTVSAGSGWSKGESGYSNGTLGPYPTSATTDLENGAPGQNTVYGETYTMAPNTYYLPLASSAGAGANGFLNPYAITSADVGAPGGGNGSSTTQGWTSTTSSFFSSTDPEYAYLSAKSATYEAFQLPDLYINLGLPAGTVMTGNTAFDSDHDIVWLGNAANTSVTSASPFQLILKYQDPSGAWVPYDYWFGYNASYSWPATKGLRDAYYGSPVTATTPPPTLDAVLHSNNVHSAIMMTTDPRTMRFGTYAFSGDNPSGGDGVLANPMIESLWSGTASGTGVNPNTSSPFNVSGYGGGTGTGIPAEFNALPSTPINLSGFFLPADLSRNNLANTSGGGNAGAYFTGYADPDGIQRIADSGLFSTSLPFTSPPNTGNPFYDPNDVPNPSQRTADRPIILNRPFNSVGELGYVYRDSPWRTLDFFSVSNLSGSAVSTSPDSGLLDLFCVTDSPNTVVAGRVNLNRQNTAVTAAILNGTLANAGDSVNNTSVSSLGNASGMATALATYTSPAALVNKDQLVTGFGPYLGSGTTVNPAFGSSDEQNVKPYREAYVRALSSVGQTRTWNLLIDLVAQVGKYPPNAQNLSQFEVDGERHYWLHVAIDRFTGKIIDRQLELIGP
jgi:hypothetical protein